ncbi:hypothetical protein DFA_06846 [Cavenderia fasciculata]|uniref:Uncharacterized protein n=1 Tax=Cavenderia fasciculata TaxID=261658 RepID=F4Q2F9_CACFS|nr:uncharacterized protein DFA_06846 [Cavenderia fasciculata]EGG18179.1 hypothetical protein DFA_06846 [Cavenderia fasciculata]|eukprot:XP_004366220.1 hypothetical protein DFA_06846 [Cavenderia fasciculata]
MRTDKDQPSLEFIDLIVKLAIEREKKKYNINLEEEEGDENKKKKKDGDNRYKQILVDEEETILSWLIYLVVKCELTPNDHDDVTRCWKYQHNIIENIFNLLISSSSSLSSSLNNNNDTLQQTQILNQLISILKSLVKVNNSVIKFSAGHYLEYLKMINNTLDKHSKDEIISEIIIRVLESLDMDQVALIDHRPNIFYHTIVKVLSQGCVNHQIRAIVITQPKDELPSGETSILSQSILYCWPQAIFSNDRVIQFLMDRLEPNILSFDPRFIHSIDPNQYKYVSSRIFPMILSKLDKLDHNEVTRAIYRFMEIGKNIGIKYFWKYFYQLVILLFGTGGQIFGYLMEFCVHYPHFDYSALSIYLPSIMKQVISELKRKSNANYYQSITEMNGILFFLIGMVKSLYPYFLHLVDSICELALVDIMYDILEMAVAKEGLSQKAQYLFDRFTKSLLSSPVFLSVTESAERGGKHFKYGMNQMKRMIDIMQGVWTTNQIQNVIDIFIRWDNQSLRRWHLYDDFDDYGSDSVCELPALPYSIPTLVYKWQILCDYEQDRVKAVVDYYQQIIPLLFQKISWTSQQISLDRILKDEIHSEWIEANELLAIILSFGKLSKQQEGSAILIPIPDILNALKNISGLEQDDESLFKFFTTNN